VIASPRTHCKAVSIAKRHTVPASFSTHPLAETARAWIRQRALRTGIQVPSSLHHRLSGSGFFSTASGPSRPPELPRIRFSKSKQPSSSVFSGWWSISPALFFSSTPGAAIAPPRTACWRHRFARYVLIITRPAVSRKFGLRAAGSPSPVRGAALPLGRKGMGASFFLDWLLVGAAASCRARNAMQWRRIC